MGQNWPMAWLVLLPADDLTVVVNTGDDFEHLGLTICPDLDTVCYTLAGMANPETGWGQAGETWSALRRYPGWVDRIGSAWEIATWEPIWNAPVACGRASRSARSPGNFARPGECRSVSCR